MHFLFHKLLGSGTSQCLKSILKADGWKKKNPEHFGQVEKSNSQKKFGTGKSQTA